MEDPSYPVPFDSIRVGMSACVEKIIEEADVYSFAEISKDFNPMHFDDEFASACGFEKRIAHGMISSSLFSGLFGLKLPGPGSLFVSQSFRYKKPVYLGDSITAQVEVVEINPRRRMIDFSTICSRDDEIVISGEARIFVPKNRARP
jgi:3-hydroxybutyryl-CoA dehydratase